MSTGLTSKKVLLITNDFHPSRGGIQGCIMGLASSLGERTVVLAPYYSGYNIAADNRFIFRTIRTNGLRQDRVMDKFLFIFLRRPIAFLIQTMQQIHYIRKTEACDLIICGHLTTILVGMLAKKFMSIPLGCLIHGKELFFSGMLKSPKDGFAKFLLKRADFLFLSNSFMEDKLQDMGVSQKRIIKIPFGVNIPDNVETKQCRKKSGKRIILTVARLVERKGHEVVLEALPTILKQYPTTKYWIVGKGPLEKKLRNIVVKKKLSKAVKFYGEVKNIADFYANCDVFVMSSKLIEKRGDVEGFGLVFLEANYFGKPVIAGRSGGISDAVLDGVTGILVNPEDAGEIADAILRLFNNPELAKKLGEQGRARIKSKFTWENAAKIILEVSQCGSL